MRISARNLWGAESSDLDSQRKDLWVADFSQVLKGLDVSIANFHFFVDSITLPELAVQTDTFRRGSVNYLSPGWDAARGLVKFSFRYDSPSIQAYSQVFDVFDRWERRVRAGREGHSAPTDLYVDDFPDFRVPFAWDVDIHLLRGLNREEADRMVDQLESDFTAQLPTLNAATSYRLVRCWLASRSFSEFDHNENGPVKIQAQIACEDVVMLNS